VDRGELTGIIKPVLVNTWEVNFIATNASGGIRARGVTLCFHDGKRRRVAASAA